MGQMLFSYWMRFRTRRNLTMEKLEEFGSLWAHSFPLRLFAPGFLQSFLPSHITSSLQQGM